MEFQRGEFSSGSEMRIAFRVTWDQKADGPLEIGIGFEDSFGIRVFSVATYLSASGIGKDPNSHKIVCLIQKLP